MARNQRPGYDRRLLAHKVTWEGGVLAALQYGLTSTEIADTGLARRWARIERLHRELMPLVSDLERDLRQAA